MRAGGIAAIALAVAVAGCAGATPRPSSAPATPDPLTTMAPPVDVDANASASVPPAAVDDLRIFLYDCSLLELRIPVHAASLSEFVPAGYRPLVVGGDIAQLLVWAAQCGATSTSNQSYAPSGSLLFAFLGLDSLDPSDVNFTYAANVMLASNGTAQDVVSSWNYKDGPAHVMMSDTALIADTRFGTFSATRQAGQSQETRYTNGVTVLDNGTGVPLWITMAGHHDRQGFWSCEAGSMPFAAAMVPGACAEAQTERYAVTLSIRRTQDTGSP